MSQKTIGRWTQLIILLVLQVLFLGGIAGSYYAVGWFGQEIRIKTAPVDPRDLLYGDYVTLSYEISQLRPELWKDQAPVPARGSKVYVLLKQGSGNPAVYEAAGLYGSKPSAQPGEVILQGQVDSSWDQAIRVTYGIEKYYVPEGTGKELEKEAGNMIAKVKIASWGQKKLEGLENF
ncbi:GDYXXLXY domain-containing protein [Paenibacillus sp. TAB 01]|uniref:GDYXXLXY domain-containing protein n=1 Tax=Paenibacillus sp. TAB 01 TaxID=3368988 RepID=UPI0037511C3B